MPPSVQNIKASVDFDKAGDPNIQRKLLNSVRDQLQKLVSHTVEVVEGISSNLTP